MLTINMLQFWNCLFAGMLAGFEIAVHYGLGAPPRSLPEASQILLRQALILRLRVLAPALFFLAFACGVSLTIHERHSTGVWFYGAAMALFGLWMIIRIMRTIPMNSAALEWRPESPPAKWRTIVERTELFHVIAAWASVIAFIFFLLPAIHPW